MRREGGGEWCTQPSCVFVPFLGHAAFPHTAHAHGCCVRTRRMHRSTTARPTHLAAAAVAACEQAEHHAVGLLGGAGPRHKGRLGCGGGVQEVEAVEEVEAAARGSVWR